MGHLPDNGLHTWGAGQQLTAAALNENFATLREYAEQALAQALMPDAAVVQLEMRLGRIEARLQLVEHMLTLHARQRNGAEWAPLSHLGAVLQRVDGLQRDVETAVARLEQMVEHLDKIHDDQRLRLARLEQQPVAATLQQHQALITEHEETARKAQVSLVQAIGTRQEVHHLREVANNAVRENERTATEIANLLGRIGQL